VSEAALGQVFCQEFSPLPVTISPLLHTHSMVVCSGQCNNTDSRTKLFCEAVSEGMSRFRAGLCRFSCVRSNTRSKNINSGPVGVTRRTDRPVESVR